MEETLEEKIKRLTSEQIDIVPYDPQWPKLFEEEKKHLEEALPGDIARRIEHFGSTAIPGIAAKPIVDILVEVSSLGEIKKKIVPILEKEGYEYLWRSTFGSDPPFYAWFIKRNAEGRRTHHIHMVEKDFPHWERLYFRDYLREFPEKAKEYGELKEGLSKEYPNDRVAYTEGKTKFIKEATGEAERYYKAS